MANDPAAEFQHLLNQKDMAAYRCVAVLGVVLDFWEAQDYDCAKAQLERARANFQEAEERIQKFRQTHDLHSKGETLHGNRSAA